MNNNIDKQDKRTPKRKLGDIGENVACEYLARRGFEIIERNYLRKWGEIDIVARKAGIMRFIEVKSVSCVNLPSRVPHGTLRQAQDRPTNEGYRPEDNMHPGKLRRLARTIQTYMLHKKLDCDWQLDLVTAKIDKKNRLARVEMIENIVI